MEQKSLGVIEANYAHNADNLTKALKSILEEYQIQNKVRIMVTDHADTMGKVCDKMGYDFHGCFGHFLNLVCQLFFKVVNKSKANLKIDFSDDEGSENEGKFFISNYFFSLTLFDTF